MNYESHHIIIIIITYHITKGGFPLSEMIGESSRRKTNQCTHVLNWVVYSEFANQFA